MTLVLPHLPNPNANPNRRSGYATNKGGGMYNPKLSKAKKADREEILLTVLQQGRPDKPIEKAHIDRKTTLIAVPEFIVRATSSTTAVST